MTNDELEQIRKIVKEENEPINKRLDNVEKNMATKEDLASAKQEIKEAIKQEAETMADFFHDTWDKMQTTNERVEKIEDHLGLPHSHNN